MYLLQAVLLSHMYLLQVVLGFSHSVDELPTSRPPADRLLERQFTI